MLERRRGIRWWTLIVGLAVGAVLVLLLLLPVAVWVPAVPRGHTDIGIDISPSGNQLVFAATGGGYRDLYVMDLRDNHVTPLTGTSEYETDPAFSPDGKLIVYAGARRFGEPSHIFIRSLDGTFVRQLTTGGSTSDQMPSMSPDGSEIVFARACSHRPRSLGGSRWDLWDVFAMQADGSRLRAVTRAGYYDMSRPRWERSNGTLVYSATPNEGSGSLTDVLRVNAVGNAGPQHVTTSGACFAPDVSPDRQFITFQSGAPGRTGRLMLMRADGTDTREVSAGDGLWHGWPLFTPNGAAIVFLSIATSDMKNELWQVDLDGRRLHRIADSRLFDDPLHWQGPE
jgi:Tol biopolymer transport system component